MSELSPDLLIGAYLPSGEFVQHTSVRAYEPRADGQLDAGGVLRYCELVANAASSAAGFTPQWYEERGEAWVIFRTALELGVPISSGEALQMMTWVSSYARVRSQRNYHLTRVDNGGTVARATITWAYIERASQIPRRIPAEITSTIPLVSRVAVAEDPTPNIPLSPALSPATLLLRARGYEADSLKHINNCVYADWLSEAARLALREWASVRETPLDLHDDHVLRLRRLDLHYQRSARPDDEILITTTATRADVQEITLAQVISLHDMPDTPLVTARALYGPEAN